LQSFLDHYYPVASVPPSKPPPGSIERVSKVTGHYRSSSSSHTTFERLFSEVVGIAATKDGAITTKQVGYQGKTYVEVEPYVFNETGGQRILVFRKDDNNKIAYMFSSSLPHKAFIRLSWYESPPFHLSLLIACIIAFTSVPWRLIRAFRQRRRRATEQPSSKFPQPTQWVLCISSVMNLVSLLLLLIVSLNLHIIEYGVPLLMYAMLVIALVASVLVIGTASFTILSWKNYWGNLNERVHYTLVTLAIIVFIWQLSYFNLLGFQF